MSGNNNTTLAIIGVVSVATIFGAYAYEKGLLPSFGSGIVAGQIPACESPATVSLATRAFHQAPRIKQLGVTIQRMNTPGQQYERKDDAGVVVERSCLTEIYTNSGHSFLGFKMTWTTPARTELWLEIPVLPF
jgi:hypothetical protein